MYIDLVVDYGQVMAEYFLIAETSAVTLTIAGVIKEVVTIVVSSFHLSMGGQMLEIYNVLCEVIMYKCHRIIQKNSVVLCQWCCSPHLLLSALHLLQIFLLLFNWLLST
jgi:hypothetical protein